MTSLLLDNCRLIATFDDADTRLTGSSIAADDGWITHVGDHPPAGPYDSQIDCRDMLAVPGFVNTHHHLYQTLTRAFPESRGLALFPWLQMLYPIWAGLDEEMIRVSTLAGLAELALSGCTTCADHLYVFPPGSEHFLAAQVEAAKTVGLRFHPTRGSMDLSEKDGGLPPDSVVQVPDVILQESERAIQQFHDRERGAMVRVGLAPCSPFSASPDLMRETANLARARGVRLHTHIAETRDEEEYSRERFGVAPVQLLRDLGWLGPDVWLAHCVHVDAEAMSQMGGSGTSVAHCPTSNMLLASGLAPVRQLVRAGVRVGLGVDGSASNDANDLRAEIKQAVLTARVRDGSQAMSAADAVRIATRGGAACLGRDDIGSIEVGKAADIALFDADALDYAGGQADLVAAMVLGGGRPRHVIVHGELVVQDGELTRCDRTQIAAEQNAASWRLLRKANVTS